MCSTAQLTMRIKFLKNNKIWRESDLYDIVTLHNFLFLYNK